ncbi:MAG TPA: TIM barrel protein [Phycisphaerales bacterium]|nr:TIM barrel protein [Phycisphaerales bacterium]
MFARPPLSMALCALPSRDGGEARAQIEAVAAAGYRWVQLDAAAPGLRARELSRSARRDLAALLRRCELSLSGLDLWIPEDHFASPEHADRAVAATTQAIALAADLAALTAAPGRIVSIRLPQVTADGVEQSLLDAAQRFDVRIADHALPVREPASADSPLGVGVDPAAVMIAGEDPAALTARIGNRLASLRLSDLDAAGSRVAPGHGRLDIDAYIAAASVAGWEGPPVLDLRGVGSPERAMSEFLGEWGKST